ANPASYSKVPAAEKAISKMDPPRPDDRQPVIVTTAPAAMTSVSAPPVPPGGEQLAVGTRSISDSGSAPYVPAPVTTLPPGPTMPPLWQMPEPPQGPRQWCNSPECYNGGIAVNAFTPREMLPAPPYSAQASLQNNAFSTNFQAATSQPMPP